jgi:hypothetical protein
MRGKNAFVPMVEMMNSILIKFWVSWLARSNLSLKLVVRKKHDSCLGCCMIRYNRVSMSLCQVMFDFRSFLLRNTKMISSLMMRNSYPRPYVDSSCC